MNIKIKEKNWKNEIEGWKEKTKNELIEEIGFLLEEIEDKNRIISKFVAICDEINKKHFFKRI